MDNSHTTNPRITENTDGASSEKRPGRLRVESWLNQSMRIRMTDGRVIVGIFLCTDKDKNIILGNAVEYVDIDECPGDGGQLSPSTPFVQPCESTRAPRTLGLAMVPGNHVVSVHLDQSKGQSQSK